MIDLKPLSVGPVVGHTDADSVRLWGRARYELTGDGNPRRCFGVARVRRKASRGYEPPRYFKMNPNFDMSGIAVFSKLKPDTEYVFQMGWFFSDKDFSELFSTAEIDWHNASRGEFRSASNDTHSPCEFVFGSHRYRLRMLDGRWYDDRGDKAFRTILRQIRSGRETRKLLLVGDQPYTDDLSSLGSDHQVDEYLQRYQQAYSQRHIRALMSGISTYMTLDDNSLAADRSPHTGSGEPPSHHAAAHALQIYRASHSPLFKLNSHNRLVGTPNAYYYDFKDGCCEFFVTDTRTERRSEPESNAGEIIGQQQMCALLAWLNNGFDGVKFIVSSVPFFPDSTEPGDQHWGGFCRQRDQIFAHIRKHRIDKVIFLCGGSHSSVTAEMDISADGDDTLKIYSVIASAFYWPYPRNPYHRFHLSEPPVSADKNHAYRLGTVSDLFSGDGFVRVRATVDELTLWVYERKGKLVREIQYCF
ncbi:alkaline phosphatase family protein [Exilibacterium tricleocarpae]|uniref:Alkaline phosphatase family protein n=1 Tax=Exilibacterium tricleocarpae TaxID=2591008 RepID=A0A545U9D2_9GAMM|nr:alkaline phosphatase D family protein [Exilibacterium tricleocarpae]TQV86080.1 alkaline phosphatase family protein [Exilibacterium tricleocarpae]